MFEYYKIIFKALFFDYSRSLVIKPIALCNLLVGADSKILFPNILYKDSNNRLDSFLTSNLESSKYLNTLGKTQFSNNVVSFIPGIKLKISVRIEALPLLVILPNELARKGNKVSLFMCNVNKMHASHATSLIEVFEDPKQESNGSISRFR